MKKTLILLLAAGLTACTLQKTWDGVPIGKPISVTFPTPTESIASVALTAAQKEGVKAGNELAFRLLDQLYDGESFLCSPLSLQCALGMTANGASGETLQEILDVLGYGTEGVDAMNAYHKTLLEQLPAVDLKVTLKLTDALLVNDLFPLLPGFQETVQDHYYAAVENDPFDNPEKTTARVNEWASRNTDGFLQNILQPSDVAPNTAAYLMNALYFKAKWAGSEDSPMFQEKFTKEGKFTTADGSVRQVSMMHHVDGNYYRYAEMDGYTVLALPFGDWKYYMYFLLPDGNDLKAFTRELRSVSWNDVLGSFKQDAEVYVSLPKFDLENRYSLKETLQELGIRRAFVDDGSAQFDRMFAPNGSGAWFWINEVYQSARISVAEWGTEAASVTVVDMVGPTSPGPGEEPKRLFFNADHPFVFLVGEATSGTILFAGAYNG